MADQSTQAVGRVERKASGIVSGGRAPTAANRLSRVRSAPSVPDIPNLLCSKRLDVLMWCFTARRNEAMWQKDGLLNAKSSSKGRHEGSLALRTSALARATSRSCWKGRKDNRSP
mmetsp:Transcript_8059/g.10505  ORF Transcript_8059/g.10505 Transcript_8059/m.10505 type:complete len:115 (+) Transcript_8059:52-396(+)